MTQGRLSLGRLFNKKKIAVFIVIKEFIVKKFHAKFLVFWPRQ